jgi:flagellar hook-basal body complex protein FliE
MALPVGAVSNPFKVGPLVENGAAGGSASPASPGGAFGKALAKSIDALDQSQAEAAQQTQALATGQATDLSAVVMSVEKASLEVQLATQVRTKATDAFQQIMQMQV